MHIIKLLFLSHNKKYVQTFDFDFDAASCIIFSPKISTFQGEDLSCLFDVKIMLHGDHSFPVNFGSRKYKVVVEGARVGNGQLF